MNYTRIGVGAGLCLGIKPVAGPRSQSKMGLRDMEGIHVVQVEVTVRIRDLKYPEKLETSSRHKVNSVPRISFPYIVTAVA